MVLKVTIKPNKNIVVIYHSADYDGHASGALLKYALGDVTLVPMNYGYDVPWDIMEGAEVYMADFSMQPVEDMKRLQETASKLVWLDHHFSTIQAVYDKYPEMKDLDGARDKNFSGCELTWTYLYPSKKMPLWLQLLGRYDVWDHSDEEKWEGVIRPFQLGMQLYDSRPDVNWSFWQELINRGTVNGRRIDQVMDDGTIIDKYKKSENSKLSSKMTRGQ